MGYAEIRRGKTHSLEWFMDRRSGACWFLVFLVFRDCLARWEGEKGLDWLFLVKREIEREKKLSRNQEDGGNS